MTAQLLISQFEEMGFTLYAEGDKVKMRGTGAEPTDAQKDALRRFKPEILAILNPPKDDLGKNFSPSDDDAIWHRNLPATQPEETSGKIFPEHRDKPPTREEIESAMDGIDQRIAEAWERIEPDIAILRQIRDNNWWEVCDVRNFDAFCRKYMKRTGRRINQMIQAEIVQQSLAPEAARFLKGAPESQVRALAAVPVEQQQPVILKAMEFAAARPAPVGEAARYAPKDEDGNPIRKPTAADIEAAKAIVLAPPPTAPESLFDKAMTDRSSKPELPTVPTHTVPTADDAESYPASEEEARAIARGEATAEDAEETEETATPTVPQPTIGANGRPTRFKVKWKIENLWWLPESQILCLNVFSHKFDAGFLTITLEELAATGAITLDEDEEEES